MLVTGLVPAQARGDPVTISLQPGSQNKTTPGFLRGSAPRWQKSTL